MRTTSLRISESLIAQVDRIASARNRTRSDVVREALVEYCVTSEEELGETRSELLTRLVSYPGSGKGDLAGKSEDYLRKPFDARRERSSR